MEESPVEIGRPRRIITIEPDAEPASPPVPAEPVEEPVPAGPDER